MRSLRRGVPVLAVPLIIAGCGSPSGPQPAGNSPSPISRMICTPTAAAEIAQVMGAKAAVASPTWADHVYSCGYRYSAGTMVLSIKELSSWPQTYGYFDELARTLHETAPVKKLGQGAFITSNGSVVVRKDWKILLVDISGVAGEVGSPPKPPGELAIYVAQVILGCWAGDLSAPVDPGTDVTVGGVDGAGSYRRAAEPPARAPLVKRSLSRRLRLGRHRRGARN
jgi:hypothetical protein